MPTASATSSTPQDDAESVCAGSPMQTIDEVGGAIGSKGTGRSWQDLPRALQRGTFNIPSKERNPQALSSLVWSTVVRRNVLKFCRRHGKGHCASAPQQQPFTSLISPIQGRMNGVLVLNAPASRDRCSLSLLSGLRWLCNVPRLHIASARDMAALQHRARQGRPVEQ